MHMFRAAIVGRPNVGKSTIFNRLCGLRKAIVGDEPGITRDCIYGTVAWHGGSFEIMDTGGLVPNLQEVIPEKIFAQVEQAVQKCDLLLLVVDGRAGSTPLDEQLLPILRRTGRPIWVLANKLDTGEIETHAAAFYAYGAEEVFAVSGEHNRGFKELLDRIVSRAGGRAAAVEADTGDEISLAVIGRPNVGKSSLVNRLLGSDRAIVSEIPGTTRDAVDTRLIRDGVAYRIIDTAGIRRKGRTEQRTEKVSVLMARKNLAKADVAILLLDASEGVTKLDAAIGGYAEESGCSLILVLNKWDLVPKQPNSLEEFTAALRRRMKYLHYAPILTVSASTGQRVSKLFAMTQKAFEGRHTRVPTAELNHLFVPDVCEKIRAGSPMRRLDIRYITQAGAGPPTFVVFTSGRNPLHFSTARFLQNELRARFGFYATPIRIEQRLKRGRSKRPAVNSPPRSAGD